MNQKMLERLEDISSNMDKAADSMREYVSIAREVVSVTEKGAKQPTEPSKPQTIVPPQETPTETPTVLLQKDLGVSNNETTLLAKLREWEGLHEVENKEEIMNLFRQAGFEFNPVTDPWCGAGLRAALVLSGYKDPGLAGHKASNYLNYGTPCDRKTGAIWVGNSHVAVVTENDQILGCNQSDKICEQPDKYYGIALGYVEPV